MNLVSEIINSELLENIINLPPELRNRKVELFILPTENISNSKHNEKSMYGIMNKYSNKQFIVQEKDAWGIAMKEKHGNS